MRSKHLISARRALLDNRGPSCRHSGACAALSTPLCLFRRASVMGTCVSPAQCCCR